MTNLVFVDSVPKAEVPRYWSLLDVSIIHLRKADNFTQVIPSKLFECMGMGIPVLHGVAGESAGIVEREGVGLVFEPENAQALCDGLLRLAQDRALYDDLRQHCLDAAPRYDRSALARKMLGVLERVAAG
ncbi:glycosyltransferase [Thiohalocapsa marina]|uniref:glycosyltransferase n=1 Tax=Thiohalocapsa marina TaxID=424902 RepID=UPI0036D8B5F5